MNIESQIFAVIVIYKPSKDILNNALNTSKALRSNLISVINEDTEEESRFFKDNNIPFISNKTNVGIATALNQGVKHILDNQLSELIILLDQDSVVSENMLDQLLSTWNKSKNNYRIACIVPQIADIKKINPINAAVAQADKPINLAITSGMLIPAEAFDSIGFMDESLFIDGVDYEWCLRANHLGYKIIQSQKAVLVHGVGDNFVNFLGIKKPIHKNSLRHYYIVRNSFILLRRKYIPLSWKALEFLKTIRRILAYLIYSKTKRQTAFYLYRGILDGLKNRSGKFIH